MNTVKTRKVGNSLIITIPKELKIPAGQEFTVYKGIDNAVVFAPKIIDPFDGKTNLAMTEDFGGALLDDEY